MANPLTSRSVLVACALVAALPQISSAGELRVAVAGGAAAVAYDPCTYPESGCSTPRATTTGPAPFVLAGYRWRVALRHPFALRFGATMSAVLVAPGTETRGSMISGAAEFGIEHGRFGVDVISGFSRVALATDQMTGAGGTMLWGVSATTRLTPEIAVFARLDGHAMMHGTAFAAFLGLGLEWTP